MNQKVIFSLGLIGVIILVGLYFSIKPTTKTDNSLPTSTPDALSFQDVGNLADKTNSWSTYTSPSQKYSFKVPPGWKPENTSQGGAILQQENSTNTISVSISNSGNQTAQEFIQNIYYKDTPTKEDFLKNIKYVPTILGVTPAYRIEGLTLSTGQQGPAIWVPNDKGNGTFIVSNHPLQDNTFDDFISTFKFLQ